MTTPSAQPGILAPLPAHGCYLSFSLIPGTDPRPALRALQDLADGEHAVVGIGAGLAAALGAQVAGLRDFETLDATGLKIQATPQALWIWLRGAEPGDVFHLARKLEAALAGSFRLEQGQDAYFYRGGRDLTGYEDGTENPKGDDAVAAAIAADGASFVAVQQWLHRFERFEAMSPQEQDDAIGRQKETNEELEDAPESAHVKRTAQESFTPEAFVWRRSMPWSDAKRGGLMFVAFGNSFDAFEAQLRRMVGLEDGIQDALFGFSRPITTAYYWCPPMAGLRLDLSALGM